MQHKLYSLKNCLITPKGKQEFETKIQLSDSKLEFAGKWLIGVGWIMSSLL